MFWGEYLRTGCWWEYLRTSFGENIWEHVLGRIFENKFWGEYLRTGCWCVYLRTGCWWKYLRTGFGENIWEQVAGENIWEQVLRRIFENRFWGEYLRTCCWWEYLRTWCRGVDPVPQLTLLFWSRLVSICWSQTEVTVSSPIYCWDRSKIWMWQVESSWLGRLLHPPVLFPVSVAVTTADRCRTPKDSDTVCTARCFITVRFPITGLPINKISTETWRQVTWKIARDQLISFADCSPACISVSSRNPEY